MSKRVEILLVAQMVAFIALAAHSADLIPLVDAAGVGGNCGLARGDGNNPWGGVTPSVNPLGHNLGIVWLGTGKYVGGLMGGVVPGPDTASCNDGRSKLGQEEMPSHCEGS